MREENQKKVVLRARWSVDYTLSVPACDLDEAIKKLSGKELMTRFGLSGQVTFGLDIDRLMDMGVHVHECYCYGDPEPTGPQWTRRDWEYWTDDDYDTEKENA